MLNKDKPRKAVKKEFDAVQLQREIREKLRKDYERDPNLRSKRLAAIHKKYGLTTNAKQYAKH